LTTQDFAPGERLALLDNASKAPVKAYSSVQYGSEPADHLELNSDLLFSEFGPMNGSVQVHPMCSS
jgi:hypothetical protein